MGGEQLAFHAIRLERMAADVEAEDLLLARQPLGFGHRRDVGQHVRRMRLVAVGVRGAAEHRHLPHRLLLLLERRLLHRRVERRPVLRAMTAQPVERARGDERFEHALVARAQIDAVGEVEEALERLLALRGEDRVDRAAAHVADGAEAEANPLLVEHRELVARLVHVGRQHLDVPSSRASLMNFTTESVSPMHDERIAAMKSAGKCALSHAV